MQKQNRIGFTWLTFFFFSPLFQLSDPDGLNDSLERIPRRRDPPTWLKENPDYEVEGDMLEVLSQRISVMG